MDIPDSIRKRFDTPTKATERGELLKFFSEHLDRPVKLMGIRLKHYSLDELYALRSAYSDRESRNGRVSAEKYFWWTTKTEKVQ